MYIVKFEATGIFPNDVTVDLNHTEHNQAIQEALDIKEALDKQRGTIYAHFPFPGNRVAEVTSVDPLGYHRVRCASDVESITAAVKAEKGKGRVVSPPMFLVQII